MEGIDSAVYQALLTRKYLTRKIMPMLAMVAVMLSVATILVTWSVMGGFLATLIQSGRTLVGDVAIVWPNVGFGYYDELIEDLEADPLVRWQHKYYIPIALFVGAM